jgi:lipopolysaccharide export system protein LptA
MRRTDAAKYARWSALAALVLAAITGGFYLRRIWVEHVEIKRAPPPLTADKERQSIGLTLSKGEGERTVFTLQASKSTDFKGQDISLLEDVKVTVFGKTGDRHDILHTESCRYSKADGAIQCAGNVQMDLQSAEDFERANRRGQSKANVIHVETSAVTFERGTGRAQTVQPVKFAFTNGEGEGLGAVYFSEEGALRLVRDVHIAVRPPPPGPAKGRSAYPDLSAPSTKEVLLSGSSLELGKLSRKAVLSGPAKATTSAQQLTAGEFTLLLDEQFRAQTIIAAPGNRGETPRLVSTNKESETLTANEIRAELAPEGWVRTVDADGQVRGNTAADQLQADHGTVEMWPKVNQPKLVTLRGNVIVEEHDAKNGTSRKVTTNALQLNVSGGRANEKSRIQHAETLERGNMQWTDTAAAQSKLSADKLSVDFGATGKAQHLTALGNVETERNLKGKPTQTATAENGEAQLDEAGGWTQMTLHGKVKMREADRNAEAQQAIFVRATQTAVLTGQAVARDTSSETHATKITFQQNTGEMVAEGKVLSSDLSTKKSGIQLSSAPANISADRMTGNTKSGKALYTGHARLWQGPSVLDADSIELQRDARILTAIGKVRGAFPQGAPGTNQPKDKTKAPAIWYVSSGTLTYWDGENRAHLEKDVVVQSTDQRMRGPVLDLYFTRQVNGTNGGQGASQIERAVSTGGVVVEQGDRRGTAEKGVYTAADSRFVLSGGAPTLYDAEGSTTTGRELTFNLADDTIIVDSGNGTRTLTKHRVQR